MAVKIETQMYIGFGIAAGLIVALIGVVSYLYYRIYKLNKKLRNNNDDDADSFDDDASINQHHFIDQQPAVSNPPKQNQQYPYQNPYNPMENYNIKRAKLMQSLRNKIAHPRNDTQNDYNQSMGELNPNFNEDDYPHPKNGTLRNELLAARLKMSDRKQTPQEWKDYRKPEPLRNPSVKNEPAYPPKDYPGFPSGNNNPSFTRRPFSPHSVQNYPPARPQRSTAGMSMSESETMAVYDQAIAGEERRYGGPFPPARNSYLHRN